MELKTQIDIHYVIVTITIQLKYSDKICVLRHSLNFVLCDLRSFWKKKKKETDIYIYIHTLGLKFRNIFSCVENNYLLKIKVWFEV